MSISYRCRMTEVHHLQADRCGLTGQDTCLLSVLSLRLCVPGVEHTVTHTICYLLRSWLGQTRLWVGNGADKTCDLDTVSSVWSTQGERGRDWWEPPALLIWVCARSGRIPCCLETCLCVSLLHAASLILFTFKDKHPITLLFKFFFLFLFFIIIIFYFSQQMHFDSYLYHMLFPLFHLLAIITYNSHTYI